MRRGGGLVSIRTWIITPYHENIGGLCEVSKKSGPPLFTYAVRETDNQINGP